MPQSTNRRKAHKQQAITTVVHVGFGSNMGDRALNCKTALEHLDNSPQAEVLKVSSLYLTEPVGFKAQNWFINGAAEIATTLSAFDFLRLLLQTENKMGRERIIRWGPRVIDLDILFFGDEVIFSKDLVVPHIFLQERRFVLEPLAEIAPDKVHPVLGKTVFELFMSLPVEDEKVEKYSYMQWN